MTIINALLLVVIVIQYRTPPSAALDVLHHQHGGPDTNPSSACAPPFVHISTHAQYAVAGGFPGSPIIRMRYALYIIMQTVPDTRDGIHILLPVLTCWYMVEVTSAFQLYVCAATQQITHSLITRFNANN
jgi:hypothetical protein